MKPRIWIEQAIKVSHLIQFARVQALNMRTDERGEQDRALSIALTELEKIELWWDAKVLLLENFTSIAPNTTPEGDGGGQG